MGRVARKYPQGRFSLRTPVNADEEKLYPIYLCFFCGGKKVRYNTGILSMVKDWNPKANHDIGELRASYGIDYRKKNQQLQKLLRKVDGSIFDYVEQNGNISPDIIQAFISGDDRPLRADKGQTFVAYALDILEKQYTKNKIRISTYKNAVSILNQFIAEIRDVNIQKDQLRFRRNLDLAGGAFELYHIRRIRTYQINLRVAKQSVVCIRSGRVTAYNGVSAEMPYIARL